MIERPSLMDQLSFGRNLSEKMLSKIISMGEPKTVAGNYCLFREGEYHNSVYLIVKGNVLLDTFVQGRKFIELLTLSDGEFLGCSPIISTRPMSLRATTLTETQLLVFQADELKDYCEIDHDFGYQFMKEIACIFARRLMATRLQLLDLFLPPDIDSAVKPKVN
ncbi:MAG TPA: hypothetical protein DD473_18895 [Planctomycetaceae bacterium]|nr:hypothetical protein [Planctomycetaceae bacterium]